MKILVVGASGATGSRLVEHLLKAGHHVKVIIRSHVTPPGSWRNNKKIFIIQESVLEISEEKMAEYVKDCDAVASCLGHNMTFKGIFGKPRRLVTDATKLLCDSIKKNKPDTPVKFILMNTTGNRNRDLYEPVSFGQRIIILLLRLLLPPHVDNEKAADYLRVKIGQKDPYIQWAAVRPDSLIDEDKISDYEIYASPVRSAIFNPGKTSRTNVGHFMARLITDNDLWNKWKGQMPVIYNRD